MREAFVATITELLDDDPRTALVLADISAADVRAGDPRRIRTGWSTSASGSS